MASLAGDINCAHIRLEYVKPCDVTCALWDPKWHEPLEVVSVLRCTVDCLRMVHASCAHPEHGLHTACVASCIEACTYE
jgi:hypothetical protein